MENPVQTLAQKIKEARGKHSPAASEKSTAEIYVLRTCSEFPEKRNTRLIFAPGLAQDTFLHLSAGNSQGDNEACAVRDYRGGSDKDLNLDPSGRICKTSDIVKLVQTSVVVTPQLAVDKADVWRQIINACNELYKGELQLAAFM